MNHDIPQPTNRNPKKNGTFIEIMVDYEAAPFTMILRKRQIESTEKSTATSTKIMFDYEAASFTMTFRNRQTKIQRQIQGNTY